MPSSKKTSSSKKTLDKLIQLYRDQGKTLDQKRLAEVERDIWNISGRLNSRKKNVPRREWFREHFGFPAGPIEARGTLLNAGEKAKPLWALVLEEGMAIHVAVDLLRKSKAASNTGVDEKEALADLIKRWRADNSVSDGVRAKKVKSGFVDPSHRQHHSRMFKKEMMDKSRSFVRVQGSDLPTEVVSLMGEELASMVGLAIEDAKKALRERRRQQARAEERIVSRQGLARACQVLNVDIPWGKPFDLLTIRHQKNKRVKELHPDRNNGDHSLQREFEEVIRAYGVIEQYHAQVQEGTDA